MNMQNKTAKKFYNLSFFFLCLTVVLLPLAFLPGALAPINAVKNFVLEFGVLLSLVFFILSQFVEGKLSYPRNKSFWFLFGWVVLVLISAFMSGNSGVSIFGRSFSNDSLMTVVLVSIMAYLVSIFTSDEKRLAKLFISFFSASFIAILLQVIFYFLKGIPFVADHFSSLISGRTIIGSWLDFAYFVMVTFLFSLLVHEVLRPKGFLKKLSLLSAIVCLLVLAVINSGTVWIITLISALLVFVYKSSIERYVEKKEEKSEAKTVFPMLSLITLVIGIFFFLSSGTIGATLSQKAGISFSDVRPSTMTSLGVYKESVKAHHYFGVGPERFPEAWNLYRPLDVNQTNYWNVSFGSGSSTMATFLVTHGLLAVLCLLALMIFSIWRGFALFSRTFPNRFSRFIAVLALIAFIMISVLMFMTNIGIVLFVTGFVCLGILSGVSTMVGMTTVGEFNYLKDARSSFFIVLGLSLFSLLTIAGIYTVSARFASVIYFNKAIASSDIAVAQTRLNRAIMLFPNDIYYRGAASFYVAQLSEESQKNGGDKTLLQNLFSAAEGSAQAAVKFDGTSSDNWYALASVYQLASGSSEDGAKNAEMALREAIARNPKSPLLQLSLATLALGKGDTKGAQDYIDKALSLKADYLDAFVLRSQIASKAGDNSSARDVLRSYVQIAPNDPLGLAYYAVAERTLGNYGTALTAIQRAHSLDPYTPEYHALYIALLYQTGDSETAQKEEALFKQYFPGYVSMLDSAKQTKQVPLPDATTKPKTSE